MSSNQSFQLPDLLGIISTLQLRTNRNCRFVTDASEKWFAEGSQSGAGQGASTTRTPLLSETELAYLHSTKLGLLCALCFPACDAPQLRVMTDLVTLLFYSAMRGSHSRTRDRYPPEACFINAVAITDKPIVKRAILKAPKSWNDRFSTSVYEFSNAHQKACSRASADTVSPDEYIGIREELYGTSLILDIAELLEVFQFPRVEGLLAEKITHLKHAALEVLAWSMDVVSYQLTRSRESSTPDLNLVSILVIKKELSLQGAMNLAGSMIRTAFSNFCTAEKEILELLEPPPAPALLPSARSALSITMSTLSSSASSLFEWVWGNKAEDAAAELSPSPSLARQGTQPLDEGISSSVSTPAIAISPCPSSSSLPLSVSSDSSLSTGIDDEIVKRYIQALKDCLIGTTHWAYETELFFGKKGAEVRAFGWVFVDQVPVIPA